MEILKKLTEPREVSGSLSQLAVVHFGAKARNDGLSLGPRQDRWEPVIEILECLWDAD